MDNNVKICSKCNAQNDPNANFCNSCGSKLDEKQLSTNNTNQPVNNNSVNQDLNAKTDENKKGNALGVISLILFYATSLLSTIISTSLFSTPIISKILESITSISSLAGLVIMIYGRIKYPNNLLLKITMWVMIATIIGGILLLFFFTLACISCMGPCLSDFAAGKCD